MEIKVALFVLAATILIVESHSTLDDILFKCYVKDDVCQRKWVQKVIPALQAGGGHLIEPVDPLYLHDIPVNVLDLFEFTLVNASVTGIKDCEFVHLTTHIERGYAEMRKRCNIKLEGDYKVTSSSTYLKTLLGEPLDYEGTGKLTFNNLNMFFRIYYQVRQAADGDIYLEIIHEKHNHTYLYEGHVKFDTETIFWENQKSRNFFVNFLEEHSSILKTVIGDEYVRRIMTDFYHKFHHVFFDTIPANKYLIDDLTPYIHGKHH